MNRVVVFLALLFLLPPMAVGQMGQEGPATLLEDPEGDVQVETEAGDQATDDFESLDLVAASILETQDAFTFLVKVRSLDSEDEPPVVEGGVIELFFTHLDRSYQISISRNHDVADYYFAWLEAYDAGEDDWDWIASVDLQVDEATATYSATVEREDLRDANGAEPFPGRALSDIKVVSSAYITYSTICIMECMRTDNIHDRMPDDGTGVEYEVALGVAQTGHARLFSDTPMRVSNGEATTIVYEVDARNEGDEADRFTMAVSDVPRGWSVRLPVPLIELEAGETQQVPVVASLPFNHQHGNSETFLLEMTSDSDPSAVGRVELGVHFTDVPQPSGHHSTLYLHTRDASDAGAFEPVFDEILPWNYAYWNTLIEDPVSDGSPVGSYGQCFLCIDDDGNPYTDWRWYVGLGSGLQMGLDFDLTRGGHISVPMETDTPFPTGSATLTLRHWSSEDGDDWEGVEIFTAQQDLGDVVNGGFTLEADWVPAPEADYLPFTERQSLVLEIQVRSFRPGLNGFGHSTPVLLPGGVMELPLLEYRDPVDDAFSSVADLVFTAEGPQKKPVNPGETVVLRSRLTNGMDHPMEMELDLSGSNPAWATLLSAPVAKLGAGESQIIEVAVMPPEDARDGDAADLILTAAAVGDETMRTLVRLVAEVDKDADHEDEAASAVPAEVNKDAPGFAVVPWVAGALAVLALRRRS